MNIRVPNVDIWVPSNKYTKDNDNFIINTNIFLTTVL